MPKNNPSDKKAILELADVISKLNKPKLVYNFLYDVATPQEISDLAQRFQIAKLLWTTNMSYQEISQATKASTTTITRVARFLKQEEFKGYWDALELLYPNGNTKDK